MRLPANRLVDGKGVMIRLDMSNGRLRLGGLWFYNLSFTGNGISSMEAVSYGLRRCYYRSDGYIHAIKNTDMRNVEFLIMRE